MIVLLICILAVCLVTDIIILIVRSKKRKKRRQKINKSLMKLLEKRVLDNTLKNNISSEDAVSIEYRNPFLVVDVLDSKEQMSNVFPLDEAISIGRSRDRRICIQDPTISRKHCFIYYENGILYIQENNSRIGTKIKSGLLNSIKIYGNDCVKLDSGDVISIGRYKMRVNIINGYDAFR